MHPNPLQRGLLALTPKYRDARTEKGILSVIVIGLISLRSALWQRWLTGKKQRKGEEEQVRTSAISLLVSVSAYFFVDKPQQKQTTCCVFLLQPFFCLLYGAGATGVLHRDRQQSTRPTPLWSIWVRMHSCEFLCAGVTVVSTQVNITTRFRTCLTPGCFCCAPFRWHNMLSLMGKYVTILERYGFYCSSHL